MQVAGLATYQSMYLADLPTNMPAVAVDLLLLLLTLSLSNYLPIIQLTDVPTVLTDLPTYLLIYLRDCRQVTESVQYKDHQTLCLQYN